MKRLRRFTIADLTAAARTNYLNANRLTWQMQREGLVRCESPKANQRRKDTAIYVLEREPSPRPATAHQRVWAAMRILKQFTIPELAATAEAGKNNVEFYTLGLARDGYLRIVRPRLSGVKAGSAIYALVNDVGPIAPRAHRSSQATASDMVRSALAAPANPVTHGFDGCECAGRNDGGSIDAKEDAA